MTARLSSEEVASLYGRYANMVFQIALILLRNVPDAEDVVQSVFRKVLEGRVDFHGPEHEKAWFITAARNECKNLLRHWWRTKRADGAELDNLAWEQPGDGELWELVLALPEREKLAVYLYYYQGYSSDETARIMNAKPATVRSWLARARRKLKNLLEEDG